ncbi:TrmB family transcriptional regulator [Halomicrococcus sp. NG-SE-24]|uniref:TrmB family transcriptional regulator n=1 Tax=unclassified Halomicrococcus TaxID=2614448 RepID=UPI0026A137F9
MNARHADARPAESPRTESSSNESARLEGMPDDIGSPRAKLVYLYLATTRGATVDELQSGLDLPKITLFTIVRTLRERELVEKNGSTFSITG